MPKGRAASRSSATSETADPSGDQRAASQSTLFSDLDLKEGGLLRDHHKSSSRSRYPRADLIKWLLHILLPHGEHLFVEEVLLLWIRWILLSRFIKEWNSTERTDCTTSTEWAASKAWSDTLSSSSTECSGDRKRVVGKRDERAEFLCEMADRHLSTKSGPTNNG